MRVEQNRGSRSSHPISEGHLSDRGLAQRALGHQQKENLVAIVLFGLCFSHLLNDTIQSLIPAIYPILKTSFNLDFGQIGLITLTFQLTSSLLQPLVGFYTDQKPKIGRAHV